MQKDRLFELFQRMLSHTDDPGEAAPTFIRRVAAAYALELLQTAEIPFHLVEDVVADLESEVLEMYRKTTYGFFSLQEFRETKKS